MDAKLKKPVFLTIGLVVVLVIILLLSGSNTTVNTFSIVIILALIAFIWFKYLKEQNVDEPVSIITPTSVRKPVEENQEEDDIRTKTGSPCEKAGLYVCKDHPKRTVKMKEGNRFPPCRGDKKGHSTTWVLKE